jgi:hypothetical protein
MKRTDNQRQAQHIINTLRPALKPESFEFFLKNPAPSYWRHSTVANYVEKLPAAYQIHNLLCQLSEEAGNSNKRQRRNQIGVKHATPWRAPLWSWDEGPRITYPTIKDGCTKACDELSGRLGILRPRTTFKVTSKTGSYGSPTRGYNQINFGARPAHVARLLLLDNKHKIIKQVFEQNKMLLIGLGERYDGPVDAGALRGVKLYPLAYIDPVEREQGPKDPPLTFGWLAIKEYDESIRVEISEDISDAVTKLRRRVQREMRKLAK